MSGLYVIIAVAGLTVLVLGLFAGYVNNRLWIAEATISMMVGILVGPFALDLVNPAGFEIGNLLLLQEICRLTLAMAVMGAALRLPIGYERRHWRSMAVILGIGMPLMWLTSTALAMLCLGFTFLPALALGAAMSPTDPVVAGSISGGKLTKRLLTTRIRSLLIAESGANDGVALLYVMLPILLINQQDPGTAFALWGLQVVLWQILGAIVMGVVAGSVCGRVLKWAYHQPFSERHSMLTIGLALSLTVLALVHLMGSNGILAVFVSGLALNRFIIKREAGQQHVQQVISRFFDLPAFVFLGTVLPLGAWGQIGWRGAAFAAGVLLLRRLPWWMVLRSFTPEMRRPHEAAFLGWFGPVGISTVFYVLILQHEAGLDQLWPVASMVVVASILLHGISATPLTHWAGRYRDKSELQPFRSPAEKLAESATPEGERPGGDAQERPLEQNPDAGDNSETTAGKGHGRPEPERSDRPEQEQDEG